MQVNDTERIGLCESALPVVGGGAGTQVINYRPLCAAIGAVGEGLRFGERVRHLCSGEDTVMLIIPAQEDCLVTVGLLAARDALLSGA